MLQLNIYVVIVIRNIARLLRASFQVRLKNGVKKKKYKLTSFKKSRKVCEITQKDKLYVPYNCANIQDSDMMKWRS